MDLSPLRPRKRMSVIEPPDETEEVAGGASLASRRFQELFETLAALVPGAVAVDSGGRRLTYGALDRQANRLARYLKSLGVGAGERVAVALDRSADAVVSLLAVWKAGGVWIPLDLAGPTDVLSRRLEESTAAFLVTREPFLPCLAAAAPPWPLHGRGELPPLWHLRVVLLDREAATIESQSAAPAHSTAAAEQLACLLDPAVAGQPSGFTHQDLVRRSLGLPWCTGGRPAIGHRVLQLAGGEALSLAEIFLTLPQGATLLLASPHPSSGASLGDLLETLAVTHLLVAPDQVKSWEVFVPLPAERLDPVSVPGPPCMLLREPELRRVITLLRAAGDPV